MTTPRLGAPELTSGQATPETTVNEQIRFMEQGASYFIAKDKDLATPPGSPASGDCYIVAASPTGAWTGKAKSLAFYLSSSWDFVTPIEGTRAYLQDENTVYEYDGSAWGTPVGAASSESTDSQIWTGTDTATRITPRRIFTTSAPVSVAYSATVTLDLNTGFNFDIGSLTGNLTLANPSNTKAGQSGRIRLPQDGTGSRLLTLGSQWKCAGGAPTLSTAASTVDILAYYCRTTTEIECTLSKAFA